MAIFPQGLSQIDKRCLSDDYMVWPSPMVSRVKSSLEAVAAQFVGAA